MEAFRLTTNRPEPRPVESPRERVTLWVYRRRGKFAVTPDPDEVPGHVEWFTAWHASIPDAVSEARIWLAERGLDVGEVVGG
jgi:hypothetical protein